MESSSIPDLLMDAELESLNIQFDETDKNLNCFLLLDSNEELRITNMEHFIRKLGINDATKIKVISIYGKYLSHFACYAK